jgi:hypothetical protein
MAFACLSAYIYSTGGDYADSLIDMPESLVDSEVAGLVSGREREREREREKCNLNQLPTLLIPCELSSSAVEGKVK